MAIYRAHEDEELNTFKSIEGRDTRRPPSNVPYVVDNLWAWTRPEAYPDRRRSKFASPKFQQALRSRNLGPENTDNVFRLEFEGEPVVAQLPGVEDAKYHRDCDNLRSELFDKLGGKFTWPSKTIEEKYPAGQLFQPCLSGKEVDQLFDNADALRPHKDEIREIVSYWDDLKLVEPDELADEEVGEIIFQFKDPGEEEGYWRRPVDDAR